MSFSGRWLQAKAILGFDPASEAWFWAKILREKPGERFVRVTPDLKTANLLRQNLEFFLKPSEQEKILFFPPFDYPPYTGIEGNPEMMAERVAVLNRLQRGDDGLLILPWEAVLRGTLPPGDLRRRQWTLRKGEEIERNRLRDWLVESGYQAEILVESAGQFAVRGELVDIFSPHGENPVRLEFFGDRIESLRHFDPATQTSVGVAEEIVLIPSTEFLFSEEGISAAKQKIRKWQEDLNLPPALRRDIADKIENRTPFVGRETFLPAFFDSLSSIFDYLSPETLIFLPDWEQLREIHNQHQREAMRLHEATLSPERLVPVKELFHDFPALKQKIPDSSARFLNPLCSDETLTVTQLPIHSSESLKQNWKSGAVQSWWHDGLQVHYVCHTPVQADRLKDLLTDRGMASQNIEIGSLSNGFLWEEEKIAYLTEEEIFGHKTYRRRAQPKRGQPFASFSELKAGDVLVHDEYGLCRFLELLHLKLGATVGDFLSLQFAAGDKLYHPVWRLSSLQRYIGGQENPPLDALGGTRWKKLKEKSQKQVYKIAAQLLKIHAQREAQPGYAFPGVDHMDEEFASHFAFDETRDQAAAIDDVFGDMSRSKPMDRLICGDVGYGKTEVAMRAAFKTVNAGKQVLLLVPTTILALQHFETFQERFAKLAVSIEMLSRFRSAAEQKETLEKLAEGKVDIVIGTHKLLGKKVKVKNLGLLVLDEEHRFGVRHKEKIKEMTPKVDVLTLSATPIPRTLHMSLIGIKDLSLIRTPPVDRLAVQTFVAQWDEGLVRHAIQRELDRSGQVFFIHNRVQTILSMHERLKKLFPMARIGVGHGQLPEEDLEKVMVDFLHRRVDILLTTAIVESGIDVPNANTMLINRADMFGLAQLYQLRGRVGRSDRQATCYLLVPDEEIITEDARRRLSALTRHTDLGAGFQIAQHDLEIRGAGNLLGTDQSGFIEEIGYEMYTKLLNGAIRRLKGERVAEEIDPEIQLGVKAFIPESYIDDPHLRMELYKRLSHLDSAEGLIAMGIEIRDRFGKFPVEVSQLLQVIEIRMEAIRLRLKTLTADTTGIALEFDPTTGTDPQQLVALAAAEPKTFRLKPNGLFFIALGALSGEERLEGIKRGLSRIR